MEFSGKFKEMMENESDDDDSDLIHEAFICCVCRDLLYKPVVLACGHISCFWCIHKSMSGLHKSSCPICRNRYYHFPSICQILHLVLLKMYPMAYKRRENQILEDEKSMGYFSPQFNVSTHQLPPEQIVTYQLSPSQTGSSVSGCSIRGEESLSRIEEVETGLAHLESMPESHFCIEDRVISDSTVKYSNSNPLHSNDGTWKNVSANDVLCGSCKHVLFRPIVLNCGHVFCICCIVPRTNEMFKCEVCQSPHPGDIPKVCLEFDHFLEERFPKEYGLRGGVQQKREQSFCETPNACSSGGDKEHISSQISTGKDPLPWWHASSKVHIGIGCDSCGMYPIVGDRYKCKDCVEKIGYDLCKDCYSTCSKLAGRFNQQHTPDHMFEIVKSNEMHDMMLRLLRGQLQVVSAFSDALDYGVEDSANTVASISDNTDEDAGSDNNLASSEADENQNHH